MLMTRAVAARRAGDLRSAISFARTLTETAPNRLDGWYLWGTTALMAQAYNEAEQVLAEGARRALNQSDAQSRFLVPRIRALITLGRGREACEVVDAALGCGVSDAPSLNIMGTTLSQAGRPEAALPLLKRAVTLDPSAADYAYNLGGVQQFLGHMAQAEQGYEQAIATGNHMGAHLGLARLKKWTADFNHIIRLRALTPQNSNDIARQGYALFKEYDDLGEHDAAWQALQQGAYAAQQTFPWKAAEDAQIVDAWIETTLPPPIKKAGKNIARRIFIVGLPRSGTTLVERILAAHSDVQALGELQTFGLAVKHLSRDPSRNLLDAATVRAAAHIDPAQLARAYDTEVSYLEDGSGHTIDKLPHNHDYCGLIASAFPDALIIHVRRNPMDSLFGAYKLLFAHAHRWSYSFDDLATHYGHYRRLMDHWKHVLGERLIEVSLEDVIEDPQAEIRRLLIACELTFEPACLNPHEAKGAVATASSAQIRQPINAEGVGVWRKYETQLMPLHDRLIKSGLL